MPEPDAALASRLATEIRGAPPARVTRFATGSMHYVFEARFEAGPPLVIRIAAAHGSAAMHGAARLSRQLRPLGVPLPAILAQDLAGPHPWLALERLPGTDLGATLDTLDDAALAAIADQVIAAQNIVATTPGAGRYGYAAAPEDAPHPTWPAVLEAHLERSRTRIAAAGLFDAALAGRAAQALDRHRAALAAMPATPFLHDTTTKNVIVTPEGRFSGLVDVDDLCFGDPRYVIALTTASLLNLGRGLHYARHWLDRAGPDDAPFRLYVALFLLDFMSEHGQRFNGNAPPSSPEARRHLLELFEAQMSSLA